MNAFIAVLRELWTFAFRDRFGFRAPEAARRLALSPAPVRPLLRAHSVPQFGTDADTCYISVREAVVHAQPAAHAFDNTLCVLPYATKVEKLDASEDGRWIHVRHADGEGWVRSEHTAAQRREIEPQLRTGVRYGAHDAETVKLRAMIGDEFALCELTHDLADVEYVTYRLRERGAVLPWPPVRPRTAGTWHAILKGSPGVHIGVVPEQGAVMEYVTEDGRGHVAHVDAVFPDGAIHVSEVGAEGIYEERTMAREAWREYRPIFIASR